MQGSGTKTASMTGERLKPLLDLLGVTDDPTKLVKKQFSSTHHDPKVAITDPNSCIKK